MQSPPAILALLGTHDTLSRSIVRGVLTHARLRTRWRIVLSDTDLSGQRHGSIEQVIHPGWQGIIGQIYDPAVAARIAKLNIPAVNVSNSSEAVTLPRVVSDDRQIGVVAAAEFLSQGFTHFAYVGMPRHFSHLRGEGFRDALADAGFTCAQIDWQSTGDRAGESAAGRISWLKALPKPIAILAANDVRGRHIVDLATVADLRVPDDIAVLGVDNDEIQSELASLPLSSIPPDGVRIGQNAVDLLLRRIANDPAPTGPMLIPPLAVRRRASSDALAVVGDEVVRAALAHIRARATDGLSVEVLLKHLGVSRRSLERRFRRVLNRAPLEEIRRVRLGRARTLLRESDLPIATVADLCGFASAEVLAIVFRRAEGQTPTAYRRGTPP